jgi:hypothetical protein
MSDCISTDAVESIITKRVICEYTSIEQEIMKTDKSIILKQIYKLKLTNKSVIYENQEIIALKVVTAFKNRKMINIMVVSKTQSGKTGSMCATIKQYLEDTNNLIPIDNIYIITGLSSCEWKEQTKDRMPESIHARVYHRAELPTTFVDELKNKKNVLIIMDEIQVAAKKGQTIYNTFNAAGIMNMNKLLENDIKILEFTATPDGTIYDLMDWTDSSAKILADGGDGYISTYDLLKQGRIKQYKDLCGYDKETKSVYMETFNNIREIETDLSNFTSPKYHVIRTKSGSHQDITIDNFKKIFNTNDYDFIKFDRTSDIKDINDILLVQPQKHTFIFIKEMLRCAKTLCKKYIGITYERFSKTPDDATIIQGLAGRNTGYDDNGVSICYTNIDSINRYELLWISNFEDQTILWNSKTTHNKKGIMSAKNTFNNPIDYYPSSKDRLNISKEPTVKIFKTYADAKTYFMDTLSKKISGRGPNDKSPNADGFYEANIRSNKHVYSCDEININKKWGLNEKHRYRLHTCYKDVTDKSTLEWWLIYYEIE